MFISRLGRKRKESSSRKGSRAKRKKRERKTKTGTNEEKWSEQTTESCDVEPTPPNTPPHPHHNSTRASFSDDEDMIVDFDLDIDTDDDARNQKNDGDWKDCPGEVSSITGASPDRSTNKEGFAETGDTHKENYEKKKGQTKRQISRLDVQGGCSSASTSPGKICCVNILDTRLGSIQKMKICFKLA